MTEGLSHPVVLTVYGQFLSCLTSQSLCSQMVVFGLFIRFVDSTKETVFLVYVFNSAC